MVGTDNDSDYDRYDLSALLLEVEGMRYVLVKRGHDCSRSRRFELRFGLHQADTSQVGYWQPKFAELWLPY